jgi:hypothetical protein
LRLVAPPLHFLLVATVLFAGGLRCGVSFHDSFTGTEVFKGIVICDAVNSCTLGRDHQFPAGSHLRIDLAVAQDYAVPLEIACYYDDESHLTADEKKVVFQERAILAGRAVLPPAPEGRPREKSPAERHLIFNIELIDPGDYFLACLTPAAADNGIGVNLKVR